MEDKVKILAIAPYEGLAAVLEREARAYHDVELTVVTGNLEKGVAAAIEHLTEPYDLILSRGGTAELLRKNLDFPVVDIKTSAFDVLQALQLAEGIQGRKAVVGFQGITDPARNTSDVLGLGLDIFTLVEEDDVRGITASLSAQGYETVLCDVISAAVFREEGFNTILITSGSASVRESIDEAVRIVGHLRASHTENVLLREVIKGHDGDTVIMRSDGRITFTTLDQGGARQVIDLLRELLPEVIRGDVQTARRSFGGTQYVIKTRVLDADDDRRAVFYLAHGRMGSGPRPAGITFYTKAEANREYLDSVYSITGDVNDVRRTIEDVDRAGHPLLVTGEYGTGRTALAFFAYANSRLAAHPLVEIDCGMLTERSRDFLLNNRNSPLFGSALTLHIKNMESCTDAFINELFSALVSTDACRRDAVIFSCNPRGERVREHISYIKDKFQCMEVELLPLRNSRERIPTLARLYLSQLNADLPRDVLRIDRQAMDLLAEYGWPGNYVQFKRILSQLVVISRDHVIRASDVRSMLALEHPVYPNGDGESSGYGIDLDRPLAVIERDIIETVVRHHGGNQSAAARQLGISRTTLWRTLRATDSQPKS